MTYWLAASFFLTLALFLMGLAKRPSVRYPTDYPNVVMTDGPVARDQAIPRIIWSYWHAQDMPMVVKRCIANWRRLNPEYEVHVLSAHNVSDFLSSVEIPPNFEDLPPFRQSDWVRIALLRTYGGVWLDASVFLTRPLAWVEAVRRRTGAEYVGFYIEKSSVSRDRPIVENWFMASPLGSQFCEDLYLELTREVLPRGERGYLRLLRQTGEFEACIQGIDGHVRDMTGPEYLVMHVAASRLMRRQAYRLCLLKAEESGLFHPSTLGWRNTPLYLNLCAYRAPEHLPAVIKLLGGYRRYFEPRLKLRLFSRGSIVGRYLMQAH